MKDIESERLRMEYEKLHFGRYLNAGLQEHDDFWNAVRHKAGNRWWHPWSNKSDYEILKEEYYKAKRNGDIWGVPKDFNIRGLINT